MRIVTDNAGRPLARTAFWVTTLAVLVIALWPQPPSFSSGISDKIQHGAAFAALTLLAVWAFPRRSWAWIIIGLAALGAFIEIAQATPLIHRDCDILDWVADMIACMMVLGGLYLVRPRKSQS